MLCCNAKHYAMQLHSSALKTSILCPNNVRLNSTNAKIIMNKCVIQCYRQLIGKFNKVK